MPKETNTTRLNLILASDTANTLSKLKKERNTSAAQVVRQAIATEEFVQEQIRQKNKILIQTPDGSLREVIFKP